MTNQPKGGPQEPRNKEDAEQQAAIEKIKSTTTAMTERTRIAEEYNALYSQYRSAPPDKQREMYGGLVDNYNKYVVAYNALNERRMEQWDQPMFDVERNGAFEQTYGYPPPNLSYPDALKAAVAEYEGGLEMATPEEPKDWRPGGIPGDKPLSQLYVGAQNYLNDKKLNLLGSIAGLVSKVTDATITTENQAFIVDTMRDMIGWGAEANATMGNIDRSQGIPAYLLSRLNSILKVGTDAPMEFFNWLGRAGKVAVGHFIWQAEIRGQELAELQAGHPHEITPIVLQATPRERYEILMGGGGTTNPISNAIVNMASSTLNEFGLRASTGNWGGWNPSAVLTRAAAKIVYSWKASNGFRAEYMRQLRTGKDPSLIARELSDPIKEMTAEIIFDPSNFLDLVLKPFTAAAKLSKIKQFENLPDMLKAAGKMDELADFQKATKIITGGGSADEIADAYKTLDSLWGSISKTSEAGIRAAQTGKFRLRVPYTGMKVGGIPEKTVTIGGPLGRLFARTSTSHVDESMIAMQSFVNSVLRDVKYIDDPVTKAERISEIFWASGRLALGQADDAASYHKALGILGKSTEAGHFLSESGAQTSRIVSELMFTDSGKVDPAKLQKLVDALSSGKGSLNATSEVMKKIFTMMDDVFPDIGRRLDLEAQAADATKKLADSKKVLGMQDDLAKMEKKAKSMAETLKTKLGLSDQELAAKIIEWSDNPKDAPALFKKINELANKADLLKDTIRQASEIPNNLKYWANNPVSKIEKLGWKVLEGQKKLYNTFMPFLNRIYIRWNPGQWGRNFITNEMHILYDYGITAAGSADNVVGEAMRFADEGVLPMNLLTGRKSALTGEQMTGLFSGPLSHKIEQLGQAQAAVSSIKNTTRKIFNSNGFDEVFKVLSDSGASDDIVRAFRVEAERGLSAQKAAEKILGGDIPRSCGLFLNKEDKILMDSFNISQGLDDILSDPAKILDDAEWSKIDDIIKSRIEAGKAIQPSKGVDGFLALDESDQAFDDAFMGVFADAKNERNPMLVVNRDFYRAQHAAYKEATNQAYILGNDALTAAGKETSQEFGNLYLHGSGRADIGMDAIEKSQTVATTKVDKLWSEYHNLPAGERSAQYATYRARANDMYFAAADEQHIIRQNTLREMETYLGSKGANVKKWKDDILVKILDAQELWGSSVFVRGWGLDDYISNGHRINFIGDNGNPVLNAFASRGIPLATDPVSPFAAKTGSVSRPYSWKHIQNMLRKEGMDLDIARIAKGDLSLDEMKDLERIVDKIANSRMARPVKYFGGKPVWRPSTEWQEVAEGFKPSDVYETMQKGDKTLARVKPGYEGMISNIDNEDIIRQLATKDEAKQLDALRKAEQAGEQAGKEGTTRLAQIKAARDSKIRQDEIREIEAAIMARFEGLPTTMSLPDTAAPVNITQGMAQQEVDIRRAVREVREKALNHVNNYKAGKVTRQQRDALWRAAKELDKKIDEIRPIIARVARADMDFTMLNYNSRRGFDVLLGFLYPYHYWYSRTYANWMKRIAQSPAAIAAYAIYRDTLEEIHADSPDWYKQNLNTNELFGLDSDSPLYFNLEATFNPLNGLTGVDFSDPDRAKGWFANFIQEAGKFGPSVHTPITIAIGLAQLALGDKDAASGWLGRLIPQTATLKAITNLLNLDPLGQGVGGLEIDPMLVLTQGGQSKWEIRGVQRVISQFEAEGKLPDGTPFSHEQAIEAQHAQSGKIWALASQVYNRQRSYGRMLSAFGGPGFQSRPKTDLLVDQFYQEVNNLWAKKGLMDSTAWSNAMSALYKKYPFATGLLMARKSGVARDEALAYDVLRRIPPGQTSDFARLVDIDGELLDLFYERKGFVDDKGALTMTQADLDRFMAGIRDLGAVLAMPKTAIREEWDAARRQYSKIFSIFGDDVMRKVDEYYTINSEDMDLGRQYMNANPEVRQYMEFREKAIMEDALLFRYYGGIDFVEKYYKRIMAAEAEKKWPGIERLLLAYGQVKDNGGNTTGFIKEHPELKEYWDFIDEERGKINNALSGLSGKIPEVLPVWRKDITALSVRAKEIYENRNAMISKPQKEIDSLALPFIGEYKEATSSGLTAFLDREAEKMWPGITELYNQYKEYAASSPAMASAMLLEHPELKEYKNWMEKKKKAYNAAMKMQGTQQSPVAATWADWSGVFSDSTRRLLEDYFRDGIMSDALRSNITRILAAAGVNDVDAWLAQMAASVGAQV
jgi:hypothetical protein